MLSLFFCANEIDFPVFLRLIAQQVNLCLTGTVGPIMHCEPLSPATFIDVRETLVNPTLRVRGRSAQLSGRGYGKD